MSICRSKEFLLDSLALAMRERKTKGSEGEEREGEVRRGGLVLPHPLGGVERP
jgi:hypothetical protein